MIEKVKFKNSRDLTLVGNLYSVDSESIIVMCHGYTPEIITMVLSGALTDSMNHNWSEIFTKKQMKELEEKGYLTEYTPQEIRKEIVIDKRILKDFELIDQNKLLEDVNCPVLIIHGNNDEEGKLLYKRSKAAMTLLSSDSKSVNSLKIVPVASKHLLTMKLLLAGITD
ncbi:hypothetical protein [Tissierella sp.]|uniref:hypothetical protein n=1 Tax=Tissierella sp. TaxID=41274 RepID=UPI0028A864A0|nr:hypothetical protein [Tissierella sp.]